MKLKKGKIKISYRDLQHESTEKLWEMKNQLEFHLVRAKLPKNVGNEGFNIREEKKNIARIKTILNERIKNDNQNPNIRNN